MAINPFSLPRVGIITVLLSLGTVAKSAEVGCDSVYKGSAHRNEEVDKKFWPSGFRPVTGMCLSGFLRGKISEGDFEKVRDLYAKNHPFLSFFYLLSPGGDVDEAQKIGAFFRKYLIHAFAPWRFPKGVFVLPTAERVKCEDVRCACASACALIWFGAVERSGTVGLHRPRTEDQAFKKLPPDEASKVYRRALDEIVRYLDEMEAPEVVIDAMVTTSSADVRWADVTRDGLERAPSFAEWVDASCGRISTQEYNTMLDLEKRKSSLGPNDMRLLKMLTEKDQNKNSCETYLITSSREKLPRP